MKKISVIFLCLIAGCASSGKTTLLGLGIGTLAGAGIGAAFDAGPKGRARPQNTFLGSTIGGIVGALALYLLYPNDPTRETPVTPLVEKKDLTGMSQTTGIPSLSPPHVESKYVDDQVRGNTFVPGHLEYHIVEPSRWRNE